VQRNVGNQAMHTDMNLMACLEYAVKSLKVGEGVYGHMLNCCPAWCVQHWCGVVPPAATCSIKQAADSSGSHC
jgi:hypothetical protein